MPRAPRRPASRDQRECALEAPTCKPTQTAQAEATPTVFSEGSGRQVFRELNHARIS